MRQQRARILVRFEADGGGVGLAEEGVERDRGFLVRRVGAVAQGISHDDGPREWSTSFDKLRTNGRLAIVPKTPFVLSEVEGRAPGVAFTHDRLLERLDADAAIGVEKRSPCSRTAH